MELPPYSDYLKSELIARIDKNSSYSLRSFARDLNVSPGYLSRVLSGTKNLSEPLARKIAQNSKWDELTQRGFVLLVKYQRAETNDDRSVVVDQYRKLNQHSFSSPSLELDKFKAISEWYYSAILALIGINGFRYSSEWISEKLGISKRQTSLALTTLLRLNLIEKHEDSIRLTNKFIEVGSQQSQAIKFYHQQQFSKGIEAIHEQPIKERGFSGATLSIKKESVPEIKKRMEIFRNEIAKEFGSDQSDAVYQLSLGIFRLDSDL